MPGVVLCSISEGSKDPSRSSSEYRVYRGPDSASWNSEISAACNLEPGPLSVREAAMSFTKYVHQRLEWINSKSRSALAVEFFSSLLLLRGNNSYCIVVEAP